LAGEGSERFDAGGYVVEVGSMRCSDKDGRNRWIMWQVCTWQKQCTNALLLVDAGKPVTTKEAAMAEVDARLGFLGAPRPILTEDF